jgi:hypothetical protein
MSRPQRVARKVVGASIARPKARRSGAISRAAIASSRIPSISSAVRPATSATRIGAR